MMGSMTSADSITPEALKAEVRALAAESPDFIYQPKDDDIHHDSCSYFPDQLNPQGCIIGAAIRRLGTDVPADADADGEGASMLLNRLFGFDDEQGRWFLVVQETQDDGRSWSEAIRLSDEQAERR